MYITFNLFESNSDEIALRILHRIWNIGNSLKSQGHFYILSGRSRLLHVVGRNITALSNINFQSPNTSKLLNMVHIRHIISTIYTNY